MIIVAAIVVAAAGIVTGMILLAIGMVRGLGTRPNLVTPSAYRDGREKVKPDRTGEFKLDKAWPLYPFRQAEADLAKVWDETGACYQAMWRGPSKAFYSDVGGSPTGWWVVFPIPLTVTLFLVAAGLSLVVFFVLFALVSLCCVAVAVAVSAPVAGLLLGLEAGRRKLKRTQASCPHCFHVTPVAGVPVPGVARMHRDLRPGRLGLSPGAATAAPASRPWRLRPRGSPPPSASAARRRCPRGPGRSATSGSRCSATRRRQDPVPVRVPEQPHGRRRADRRRHHLPRPGGGISRTRPRAVIGSGQDTDKYRPAGAPITLRLRTGRQSDLIHLFDAAGEDYSEAQKYDSLRFLDDSQGLVYVLDPFSIESVRRAAAGHNAMAAGGARGRR